MYIYSKNRSNIPNALWFIYILYATGGAKNFKEAVECYNKNLTSPFIFISATIEEIEGIQFLETYLNE